MLLLALVVLLLVFAHAASRRDHDVTDPRWLVVTALLATEVDFPPQNVTRDGHCRIESRLTVALSGAVGIGVLVVTVL